MNAIRATFIDGKIVPDVPPNWPNGMRVLVVDPGGRDDLVMLTEEEQGTDPESIAKWLTWFDSLEPLILTPEDEERIRKAREDQKAYELAQWEVRSEKLERLFE